MLISSNINSFKFILCKTSKGILSFAAVFLFCASALAEPDYPRLADAIFKAENSKNHPYGIIFKGCDTFHSDYCRKICLNTLKINYKRFLSNSRGFSDYPSFLAAHYAPIGAANDPNGLNKNWLKNVTYFYERAKP